MDKKVLLGIITGVIILGFAGYAIFLVPTPSPTAADTQNQGQKSIKELLSLNQPTKCTYKDPESNEGTMFIANGKARGNFSSKGNLIILNQTSYVWTEGSGTGIKTTISSDIDKKFDFKCGKWQADESLFSLPQNVKFTEMDAVFNTQSPPATNQP